MSDDILLLAGRGQFLPAFPLFPGYTNLTSGTYENVRLIHCVEDGEVSVTWADGTEEPALAMLTGDDFAFPSGTSVTISTATCHIVTS